MRTTRVVTASSTIISGALTRPFGRAQLRFWRILPNGRASAPLLLQPWTTCEILRRQSVDLPSTLRKNLKTPANSPRHNHCQSPPESGSRTSEVLDNLSEA